MEHPTGDGEGTGLYEAMHKEVRHAVEEIKTELEKACVLAEFMSQFSLADKNFVHLNFNCGCF